MSPTSVRPPVRSDPPRPTTPPLRPASIRQPAAARAGAVRRGQRLGLRSAAPRLARRGAGRRRCPRQHAVGDPGRSTGQPRGDQRHQAATAEVQAEQPISVLSVDIARAIDHDASVELWERHRRGERNVFTRRLYTLPGQQTFDEIRKKYQRDERVPRRGRPLRRRLREAARRSDPRARTERRQRLPDVGHRQGLHDARPRQRPLRLGVRGRRTRQEARRMARFFFAALSAGT